MQPRWTDRTVCLICLLATSTAYCGPRVPPARGTALDRYVAAPDPSYHFDLAKTIDGKGYRAFVLDLTSQTWLTTKEVDRPVWKHWLTIVEPTNLRTSTGLLLIGGGNNEQPAPQVVDQATAGIAMLTGSIVAELRDVPNQPLTFSGDGRPRVEDGIIAYTWDRFLQTGDEKWPARLPMTKAAVRAMDALTSFCASDAGGHKEIDKFILAGASKRGWTTWTTAAVDDRVIGIVPIVIDTLNTSKTSAHHFAAYGFWSSALKDYQDMKLDRWAGTKQYEQLLRIEDPYSYRDRFTMPKLIVNSTGDQYFLPDNSQFYYGDLPGPKYLRYVPNTDHSLRDSDARETVVAFYSHLLRNEPLPRLSWTLEKDGSIRAVAVDPPAEARVWQATNPKARDFRLETLGPEWTSRPIKDDGDGTYVARVGAPARGWSAFFVELTYTGAAREPLKLTTQVRVVPDVLPFAAAGGPVPDRIPGPPPESRRDTNFNTPRTSPSPAH